MIDKLRHPPLWWASIYHSGGVLEHCPSPDLAHSVLQQACVGLLLVFGVCVYYCSTYYKAVRGGVERGGHVLRETTSRGQCELVCPSRTNERGGEGYCVKGGGGEEGERERERAGRVRLHYSLGY
jgi:hypothetical protein